MLEQFVELAGKKVHVEKRSLVGPQIEAFAAAVRQDDVHLLAIPVSSFVALQAICLLSEEQPKLCFMASCML